ncbi:calcium-activated chloride channel regulator 1-like [Ruditapes philippinarum]|uniref:calcium-activated chloride channel regulator 1-like n=1 Tax=Ruditapes philippinarum TaxID=129788 RepID=UPI00295B2651|nr:calcium-activated chloride channel regulator 1-like [Ruditapes philippinarum]
MWNIAGIFVCLASILYGVGGINFLNGKYRNVNIVIQNTVAENEVLIERIKQIFTNASQLLFEATRYQVSFGQINIIIPNTWSSKPEYQEIPALSELDSYITVDDGKVKMPHTKRKRKKCGSSGRYIFLPESFLLEEGKTKYGHHANVVVHEWGHLRWGLWDEYGIKKNGRFYLKDGEWKPVGCSAQITGKVGRGSQCTRGISKCDISNTETVINETCKFCPDESQPISNMSSIMAFNWLDAVVTFCDRENDTSVPVHQRHNSNGKSKQNLKCKGRSSWEVMRDHEDFRSETMLLTTKLGDPAGSEIIVISDGQDGYASILDSAIQDAVDTSVTIHRQLQAFSERFDVTSPDGTVYTKQTSDDNVVLDIPGTAIAGQYNVSIESSTSSLELYVTSLPTDAEAVRVSSWISPVDFDFSSGELPVVEADVMKGRAAVLNAIVTALVETSATNDCTISLLDDGADPDDTSDDGVYAGVIPAFCIDRNGRVSAKV